MGQTTEKRTWNINQTILGGQRMIYGFKYFVTSMIFQGLGFLFVRDYFGVMISFFVSMFWIFFREHTFCWEVEIP